MSIRKLMYISGFIGMAMFGLQVLVSAWKVMLPERKCLAIFWTVVNYCCFLAYFYFGSYEFKLIVNIP